MSTRLKYIRCERKETMDDVKKSTSLSKRSVEALQKHCLFMQLSW